MRLTAHFVASVLLALLLYPFFGNYAFLAILTGFFIDIDHYFPYIFMTGDFNPLKANNYFLKYRPKRVFCLFHTVEFLIVIAVISIFTAYGAIILGGLILHHAMDFYSEYKLNQFDSKIRSLTVYLFKRLK